MRRELEKVKRKVFTAANYGNLNSSLSSNLLKVHDTGKSLLKERETKGGT